MLNLLGAYQGGLGRKKRPLKDDRRDIREILQEKKVMTKTRRDYLRPQREGKGRKGQRGGLSTGERGIEKQKTR